MAYAALASLAQTINQILNHDHSPITLHVHQKIIRPILDHALDLQTFLEDFPEKANSLEGQIREVADKAEDVIEHLLCEKNSSECESFERQLKEVAEKFISTAGDVAEFVRNKYSVNEGQRRASTSTDAVDLDERTFYSLISKRPRAGEDIVFGFGDSLVEIRQQVIGLTRLRVLPIVGMGGSGKTTLANLIYTDPLILKKFDIQSWVTVSRDYSTESIVLDLLASLKGIKAHREGIPRKDEIRKYLMDRRYIIVMDDIWSKKAWDDVKMLFPDINNGSLIILTTRLQDVAAYASPCSPSFMVHSLSEFDSWSLLKYKVFGHLLCPREMEGAGRVIAKKCGGLPLSIVVVAGLLSKIGKTYHVWKKIAESDGKLETIISLSYSHLPHHLKSCFLCIGGFPEDYEIYASELIKLWEAEGFLKCANGSISLEEEAENCLEDLAERSLVSVTRSDFSGKIKRCRLHAMVRDFCIRQSQQEKLLVPVVDYLPTPILRRHFLPLVMKNHKRISATWYDLDLKDSVHSSHAHFIICIPRKGYRPKSSLQNFNLLRVLHVLRRNDYCDWVPSQVLDLIYLTYLASNIPTSIVPSAISKLQNLQTLVIYRSEVCLPVEIWSLRQLRHLIAFSFQPLPRPEGVAIPLQNLQTLSMAKDFECAEMVPNIKKLGICYSEEFDGVNHDDYLRLLFRLEKLKLETNGSVWPRRSPVFPQWLKKLTLSGWRIPWVYMSMFGSLPNLQMLKLRKYAFDGEHWETIEGEFVNLRLLLIDESNLQRWTTESSHFPMLKCLMLHRCPHLSEIPIVFKANKTLQLIEVDNQNQSLFSSAIKIRERWGARWIIGGLQVRVKYF